MWKHEWKLFFVCLLPALTCFETSAANQNDPLVTLKLENAPLRLALQNISRQTGVAFVYGDAAVEGIVISCDLEQIPLGRALEVLLMNTPLSFERVRAKQIIIHKKAPPRNINVAGLVVDAQTGETLPYANISLQRSRLGASADREGRFALPNVTVAAPCTLRAQHVGYFPQTLAIDSSISALRIALRQKAVPLQGLVVKAEDWELVEVSEVASHVAISPVVFSNLPSAGEKDISRSLQLLPGMNTGNYGASGVYIRGGAPSQNLVLLDGMMLYNSDHAFGLFSAVNSDAIKDVRVYKGGFPPRFGGRLSSVMEVTAKSGDFHQPHLSLGMNQLEAHGVLEIPLAGKGALLLSGRRPFSENVPGGLYERVVDALFTSAASVQYDLDQVELKEIFSRSGVRFYDLLSKLTWMPGEKDILALSFYSGRDNSMSHETFRVSSLANSAGGVVDSVRVEEKANWGNSGYSGKWHRAWRDDFSSTALITYSDYSSAHEVLHSSSITRVDAAFSSKDNLKLSVTPLGLRAANHVKETAFRLDNSWKLHQRHALEFGAAMAWTELGLEDEDYSIRANNSLALNAFQQEKTARLLSLYAQDDWTPLPKLRMTAGLRVNHYSLENKVNWEPRLSLGYPVSQRLTVKGAWGRYYQYVMQYGNDFQDLYYGSSWVLAEGNLLRPGFAEHNIIGVKFENEGSLLDVELYHKRLEGIVELLDDRQFIGREGEQRACLQSAGSANGVDILLMKKTGAITGWVSYSLSQARTNVKRDARSALSYPSNQDSPHHFKLAGSYSIRNWNFSATWQYASGKPYTVPVVAPYLDAASASTYYLLYAPPFRNDHRLPATHQLDLGVTRAFSSRLCQGKIGFSALNVYNRKNVWYRYFTIRNKELVPVEVSMLSITPTFFLELRF